MIPLPIGLGAVFSERKNIFKNTCFFFLEYCTLIVDD